MQRYSVPVRIVFWQLLVALVGAALWLMAGTGPALAALVGGVASALLSLQFALRVFVRGPGTPPELVLAAFYRAEAIKLVLALTMFVVAAKYFGHLFVPLLTTYLATLVVYRAALLWAID
ncbi:MAG: ATP synthase subunit I [Chromatiales bacterium]|nr:ATP synthase subunit I [Chromatiales bacterium]